MCKEAAAREKANIAQGLPPRKTYKFGHSVCQGGYFFAWKTKKGAELQRGDELRRRVNLVVQQFALIDTTLKVYDSIFFLFFMFKPSIRRQDIIDALVESIGDLEEWDDKHLCTGAYDLQEKYIRNELQKWGFDYEQG